MRQKPGKASDLGHSFNIQDETYFSNISRKKSIKKYEKYNQKGFDLEC